MNTTEWKSLFKRIVGYYFKFVLLFVGNTILALIVAVVLDLSILMSCTTTLWETILLAVINIGLVCSIAFSFIQLHRYLIGRTIQNAGNALVEKCIAPAIESIVSKIEVPPAAVEDGRSTEQLRRTLLRQVKKEHVSTGIRYLLLFVFRKVDLKNIKWGGNRRNLSSFLKKRSIFVLAAWEAIGKRVLLLCFLADWIFVLVLVVFRLLLH